MLTALYLARLSAPPWAAMALSRTALTSAASSARTGPPASRPATHHTPSSFRMSISSTDGSDSPKTRLLFGGRGRKLRAGRRSLVGPGEEAVVELLGHLDLEGLALDVEPAVAADGEVVGHLDAVHGAVVVVKRLDHEFPAAALEVLDQALGAQQQARHLVEVEVHVAVALAAHAHADRVAAVNVHLAQRCHPKALLAQGHEVGDDAGVQVLPLLLQLLLRQGPDLAVLGHPALAAVEHLHRLEAAAGARDGDLHTQAAGAAGGDAGEVAGGAVGVEKPAANLHGGGLVAGQLLRPAVGGDGPVQDRPRLLLLVPPHRPAVQHRRHAP